QFHPQNDTCRSGPLHPPRPKDRQRGGEDRQSSPMPRPLVATYGRRRADASRVQRRDRSAAAGGVAWRNGGEPRRREAAGRAGDAKLVRPAGGVGAPSSVGSVPPRFPAETQLDNHRLGGPTMDMYVILRRGGWRSAEELERASARSLHIGDDEMPDAVR